MANTMWFALVLLSSCYLCEAAKILVSFPLPGKSHSILGEGIVRHLVEAGHEVTYITPFPLKTVPKNLHIINTSDSLKWMEKQADLMNINAIMKKEVSFNDPTFLKTMMESISEITFQNKQLQDLFNDVNVNFDVAILEWMFTEIYVGLPAVFNCPYIWVSTIEPHWVATRLIDEALHPAYNADLISSNVTPFTFWQRVEELWSQLKLTVIKDYILLRSDKKNYEEMFGPIVTKRGRALPPYEELVYNASLMLGNSHVSLGEATRLPQNYKAIAGYHIDLNVKPLPEDLQRTMDGAKNGVIYFSMGSNLKSKDLPDELKQNLLKMFGGLKQTVLWKFEENLPNTPSNVHILQWAPQSSILSHPNCRLFITHGGLLSTTETIHFGVPIIGIPVFGDQFTNVKKAVRRGIAKKVDLSDDMVGELKEAIDELLTNPKYREKVKELSFIYHDRPVTPGKELVHWVEHVINTRGAPHLRSPALNVPLYQKLYLDLVAIIVLVLLLAKCAIKCIFCSKKKIDAKKKNQ